MTDLRKLSDEDQKELCRLMRPCYDDDDYYEDENDDDETDDRK